MQYGLAKAARTIVVLAKPRTKIKTIRKRYCEKLTCQL
jgi:hypothetical protein